jgi:hypothetical protein
MKLKESKHGNTPQIPLTYRSNPTTNISLLPFFSLSLSLLVETAKRKATQRLEAAPGRSFAAGSSGGGSEIRRPGAGWFLVSLVSECVEFFLGILVWVSLVLFL